MNLPSGESGGPPAEALHQQAWAWLRLLTSHAARDQDVQAFQRWVDASPAHLAAYREVKTMWNAVGPAAGIVAQTEPGLLQAFRRKRANRRRAFLGLAGSAAGALTVAAIFPPLGLWPAASEWNADYRTAVGEQRTVALEPGIDVTFNTRTSARRDAVQGQTAGLELLTGEAAVDLRGTHRFAVTAGAGRAEADTGQFEVRYLDGKACVTCVTGSVAVVHAKGTRQLTARQQVTYDDRSVGAISQTDPDLVASWRQGLLTFRQTRLVEVIAEINRYRSGRVVLLGDRLRDRSVSGHFRIDALDQAIDQLQYTFDLNMRSLPGGVVLLS